MLKTITTFIIIISSLYLKAQDTTELSLLFIGDIMGHTPQIYSARQSDRISYDYHEVFKYIKDDISSVDVAIANLEVTLAGAPYKGYPTFSSPDALALACKDAGIDALVTANNHSIDRGKKGILRTLNTLDSLKIRHLGTYRSSTEKDTVSPFIIEQNNIKIALLNATYGTNGIPTPAPTIVNLIDYKTIQADIEKAKLHHPDKIIMFIHWGIEYQSQPSAEQKKVAEFCFKNGIDIIIGSHPHVIQKSVWKKEIPLLNEQFVTYSLGNFVSNQRKQKTDGGQMIKVVLQKDKNGRTYIKENGYMLTWVYTPTINNKKQYYVLPCAKYELKPEFFIGESHFNKMKLFISDSRNLLKTYNENVQEYIFHNNKWIL